MVDDRTVSRELQELIVSRIRQGQETMADAIKTWTRAAQSMKAQIPSLPGQEIFTSRLPSPEAFISRLPRPEDFTSRLPRPETMVSGAYDIAVQLIAAQRRLGEQVTQAATPLIRQGAARFGPGSAPAASTSLQNETAPATPATAAAQSDAAESDTGKSSTAQSSSPRSDAAKTGNGKRGTAKSRAATNCTAGPDGTAGSNGTPAT